MNEIKIPVEEMLSILEQYPPKDILEDSISSHSRWSVGHKMIFKYKDGKCYQAYYSVGATESQDESPWQYLKEVECKEVRQVEKVTKVWELA
jgi:hypothetical protein